MFLSDFIPFYIFATELPCASPDFKTLLSRSSDMRFVFLDPNCHALQPGQPKKIWNRLNQFRWESQRLTALDEFGIFGDSRIFGRWHRRHCSRSWRSSGPVGSGVLPITKLGMETHNIFIIYSFYIVYIYIFYNIFPCFRSWTSSYKPIQWVSFWVCQDFARGNSAFLCLD